MTFFQKLKREWILAGRLLWVVAGMISPLSVARAASEILPQIDRIEVIGITSLPATSVQGALEVAPGDTLERGKVIRSAENLQSLYRTRGYEQVGIQTRLVRRKKVGGTTAQATEDVLEFVIKEGAPTRVAETRVLPLGIRSEAARKHWEKLQSVLALKIGVAPGEILDQEKVASARRAVQEHLASQEYVGARVEEVRVSTVSTPPGRKDIETGRWVALEFSVRPGDRVTFGFRGNEVFTSTRLFALVEELREIGFGRDYIGAIRSRIEEEYRSLGYALVKVEAFPIEDPRRQERHLTYRIQEGPRVRLGQIRFDGNEAFSGEDLQKQFLSKASPVVKQGYYVEKDVRKAAELLVEWMKSKGYLSAKLVTISAGFERRRRALEAEVRANLVIYVYEWDQTLVEKLRIQGSTVFSREEIERILGMKEGEPLNLFSFNEGLEALKASYRGKGYLGFRILNEGTDEVIRYTAENRLAEVTLDLSEGPRFKASQIIVEGLVSTEQRVVLREVAFSDGDVLSESKITETEERLRRLGIFSVVSLRLTDDPQKEGYKIVRILVQEGTPGVVSGGLGFRNDLGFRVFGGVAYTNLWGRNHTLGFDAIANRRVDNSFCTNGGERDRPCFVEYEARLSYVWPWFGLGANPGETTFRPVFSTSNRIYRRFDAKAISISTSWERKLFKSPSITGGFSYDLERVRQENAVLVIDNQTLTIGSITPSLSLDLRDNPLAPTRGLFAISSFELATPWLLSQGDNFPVGFWRFQLRADYFVPVAPAVTWYLSFRTGFARNTEPPVIDPNTGQPDPRSGSIPLIKHFALGGAGSLRGFKEQEINDWDFAIRGTQSYVNYRTQLDLPFSGSLRFGPFLDAANLQHDTFSFGNLRFGTGLGFHYQTPVGPVNLDFGFKLGRRPEDKEIGNIYFSIGII